MEHRAGEEVRCPACTCLIYTPNGEDAICPDCGYELSFDDLFAAEPVTEADLFYEQ